MEAHVSSVENEFCNNTVGFNHFNGEVLSAITLTITD